MITAAFEPPCRFVQRARHAALLGIGALALSVAGCASQSTESTRYTLPDDDAVTEVAGDFDGSVWLSPLSLTSYLDDQGIVMQLDDIRIHQARHHLWAEPLDSQLMRQLRERLSTALPEADILRRGQTAQAASPALHVDLRVERFQGRDDGMAVVGGDWRIRDAQDRTLSRESFAIERALDSDGYPALVRALGGAWDTLGERLAEALTEAGTRATSD
ncbi:PqiC family protein [Chromohalobacter israelensis]